MTEAKPSRTALVIAASLLHLHNAPRVGRLVSGETAGWCRLFLREAGCHWLLALAEQPRWRGAVAALERLTLPGIMLHYALRKCYLRDWALASIAEGCKRVMVLGAGFDTLCLELHQRYPGVQFIEVDHPATQAVKRAALERLGFAPRNLRFVAADLSRAELDSALRMCPVERGASSLYIAEGLLMYLDASRVLELAHRALEAAPSRIAFTFLETQPDGRPDFQGGSRLVQWWLKRVGEPFTWGVKRAELRQGLARLHCTVREIAGEPGIAARYLGPAWRSHAPLEGEYTCVADVVG